MQYQIPNVFKQITATVVLRCAMPWDPPMGFPHGIPLYHSACRIATLVSFPDLLQRGKEGLRGVWGRDYTHAPLLAERGVATRAFLILLDTVYEISTVSDPSTLESSRTILVQSLR